MDKTFGGMTDQDLEGTQLNSRRTVEVDIDATDKVLPQDREEEVIEVEGEERSYDQTFFSTNFDQSERKRDAKAKSKLPWAEKTENKNS